MKVARSILILCLVCFMHGCGTERGFIVQIDPPLDGTKQVDVVSVLNPAGLALIASITPSQWFEERDRIIASRGSEIRVERFELLPKQEQILYSIQGNGVRAVYIYSRSPLGTRRTEAAAF